MARTKARLATERMSDKALWDLLMGEIVALGQTHEFFNQHSVSAAHLRIIEKCARELKMRGVQLRF